MAGFVKILSVLAHDHGNDLRQCETREHMLNP